MFAGIGIGIDWNEWESRIGRHRGGMYMLEGDDAGHWIELAYIDDLARKAGRVLHQHFRIEPPNLRP